MERLKGKVAIVTGAARGMGAAEARRLAQDGACVVVADILDEEGKRTADQIGKSAIYVHLDVRSEAGWAGAVATAVSSFGRLDILVNNAGVQIVTPLMESSAEQFRQINEVNLIGPFLGIKAVVPKMIEAGAGSIINIASIAGLRGSPGMGFYAASKHGLLGFTKTVAAELGLLGIRVNAVCPGTINTTMLKEVGDQAHVDLNKEMANVVPLRRVGQPEDMAGIVAFLASDDSSYCNGAEFVVDGGWINNLNSF